MREIKFRGKRVDNGERVYGVPYTKEIFSTEHKKIIGYKTYIITYLADDLRSIERDEVDPNTVEQFTGLHDKNGVEIYEGDVVKVRKISIDDKLYEAKVLFQQIGRSGFAYSIDYKDDNGTLFYGLQEQKYIEVIGNIHEEVAE